MVQAVLRTRQYGSELSWLVTARSTVFGYLNAPNQFNIVMAGMASSRRLHCSSYSAGMLHDPLSDCVAVQYLASGSRSAGPVAATTAFGVQCALDTERGRDALLYGLELSVQYALTCLACCMSN